MNTATGDGTMNDKQTLIESERTAFNEFWGRYSAVFPPKPFEIWFGARSDARRQITDLKAQVDQIKSDWDAICAAADNIQAGTIEFQQRQQIVELQADVNRLNALINNPHTNDFLEAVRLEGGHQRERWAAEHDAGKTDADWFWLIGYLAGKAINKPEKQLHHIITTAAALLNWHAAKTGFDTRMRPGIAPPDQTASEHHE